MRTTLAALGLALFGCGCGGEYVLSAPDQVAPAGGEAVAVVRLGRSEIWRLVLPVEKAGIEFRVGEGPSRAAFTDDYGYAAAAVPVPEKPGKYRMTIAHKDREGDTAAAEAPVYVWDASRAVLAVDLAAVPMDEGYEAGAARRALAEAAKRGNVLYMARQSSRASREAHAALEQAGYPDGPVILWRRQAWHVEPWTALRLPVVVVERRLISPLPALKEMFPGLTTGVATDSLAAEAFEGASLKCVRSWSDLSPAGP
jgi:hypothetical protein